jgi:hypothetical protein
MRGALVAVLALWFPFGVAGGDEPGVSRCGKGWLDRCGGYAVLHLRGTPYEMGVQHGTLLRKECRSLLAHLAKLGREGPALEFPGRRLTPRDALGIIAALQRPYIPPRFLEEMRGLAGALDVPVAEVIAANLIPELFHCSGFALLPPVTADRTVLHGRVLDYGIDLRLQEHAVLVVAQPEGRHAFANVTYAGFIGSVTGMNERRISIGEMGGGGLGWFLGTPMSFLVRRVLEEAASLDEAIAVFRDSRRTCEYFYVIADGNTGDAVGMEAGARRFGLVRPGEAEARLDLPVPHTVLLSGGSRYRELARRVDRVVSAGRTFTIRDAIRLMDGPVAMRSNLHNALMAPGLLRLWVANASAEGRPAWTQPYHAFDLAALLADGPPEGMQDRRPAGGSR